MPEIKEFGGLDNQNNPTEFGLRRLTIAENVDITRNNKIVTRSGRKKLHSAIIQAASATKNSLIYQSNGNLYRVLDDNAPVLLESNLTITKSLYSIEVNDRIFWSNTAESGVISGSQSRPLGVQAPDNQGYVEVNGFMPTGIYLYALTYLRNDGFESGANQSGTAVVSMGGLSITMPSNVPSNVNKVCLYLSTANGDVMYLANTVDVGAPNISYNGDTLSFGVALVNQFCNKPMPFHAGCYYHGRMYYAHGNVLWASLPYNFELIDYTKDYIAFDRDIALVAAVNDGIYVATNDAHYFVGGSDPQDFTSTKVLDYGAIKSMPTAIDKVGEQKNGMLWASDRGAIAGFNGGQIVNLTDGVFAFGQSGSASGVSREENGQNHLVVSFNNETVPYNARQIFILSSVNSPSTSISGLVLSE